MYVVDTVEKTVVVVVIKILEEILIGIDDEALV